MTPLRLLLLLFFVSTFVYARHEPYHVDSQSVETLGPSYQPDDRVRPTVLFNANKHLYNIKGQDVFDLQSVVTLSQEAHEEKRIVPIDSADYLLEEKKCEFVTAKKEGSGNTIICRTKDYSFDLKTSLSTLPASFSKEGYSFMVLAIDDHTQTFYVLDMNTPLWLLQTVVKHFFDEGASTSIPSDCQLQLSQDLQFLALSCNLQKLPTTAPTQQPSFAPPETPSAPASPPVAEAGSTVVQDPGPLSAETFEGLYFTETKNRLYNAVPFGANDKFEGIEISKLCSATELNKNSAYKKKLTRWMESVRKASPTFSTPAPSPSGGGSTPASRRGGLTLLAQLSPDQSRARKNVDKYRQDMAAYSRKYYGQAEATGSLNPTIIVLHYTAGSGFPSNLVTEDSFEGMPPGRSCHFVVDGSKLYQLLPVDVRARCNYGVNHRAIGIEMVAQDAEDLASKHDTLNTAAKLVAALMNDLNIPLNKVYGHHQVAKADKKIVPEYLDLVEPGPYGNVDPGENNYQTIKRKVQQLPRSGKKSTTAPSKELFFAEEPLPTIQQYISSYFSGSVYEPPSIRCASNDDDANGFFGFRYRDNRSKKGCVHAGVDLRGQINKGGSTVYATRVKAMLAGKVVRINKDFQGVGKKDYSLVVDSGDWIISYGHISLSRQWKVGDAVKKDEVVGFPHRLIQQTYGGEVDIEILYKGQNPELKKLTIKELKNNPKYASFFKQFDTATILSGPDFTFGVSNYDDYFLWEEYTSQTKQAASRTPGQTTTPPPSGPTTPSVTHEKPFLCITYDLEKQYEDLAFFMKKIRPDGKEEVIRQKQCTRSKDLRPVRCAGQNDAGFHVIVWDTSLAPYNPRKTTEYLSLATTYFVRILGSPTTTTKKTIEQIGGHFYIQSTQGMRLDDSVAFGTLQLKLKNRNARIQVFIDDAVVTTMDQDEAEISLPVGKHKLNVCRTSEDIEIKQGTPLTKEVDCIGSAFTSAFSSDAVEAFIKAAQRWKGTPYKLVSHAIKGQQVDCSALVQQSYFETRKTPGRAGFSHDPLKGRFCASQVTDLGSLPRTADDQYGCLRSMNSLVTSCNNIRRGDLVFLENTYKDPACANDGRAGALTDSTGCPVGKTGGVITHVMIALGPVKCDAKGNPLSVPVIHASSSQGVIETTFNLKGQPLNAARIPWISQAPASGGGGGTTPISTTPSSTGLKECKPSEFISPINNPLPRVDGQGDYWYGSSRSGGRGHEGVDIAGSESQTLVVAPFAGEVQDYGAGGTCGTGVLIKHDCTIDGQPFWTKYCHLSNKKSIAKANTRVNKGEVIGYVGRTGNINGAMVSHLHVEYLKGGSMQNRYLTGATDFDPVAKGFLSSNLGKSS